MNFVYDRTYADVVNSRNIRNDKVAKGIGLTKSDKETIKKGSITLEDINRISQNISRVAKNIAEMGYYTQKDISEILYEQRDVFYREDLERICKLADSLKKSFFVYPTTPRSPFAKYHYIEFNNIEKITKDILEKSNEVKLLYRECGNFVCGE